jgi:hypothetical protein
MEELQHFYKSAFLRELNIKDQNENFNFKLEQVNFNYISLII